MTTVTAHEAESQIRELIARAEQGEEVVITRDGRPIARLAPDAFASAIPEPDADGIIVGRSGRRFGTALAEFGPLNPDWDDPMTEEELGEFYEGPIFPDEPAP